MGGAATQHALQRMLQEEGLFPWQKMPSGHSHPLSPSYFPALSLSCPKLAEPLLKAR